GVERRWLGLGGWIRRADRNTLIGGGLLGVLAVLAFIGPFALADPVATDASNALAGPSADHWFGTDRFGRDVLARTVAAIRLDLGLAIAVAAIGLVAGTVLGALAGYFGGWLDEVVMRTIDVISAFPGFVLALIVTVCLGNNTLNAVIGVTLASIPSFVRLTRA